MANPGSGLYPFHMDTFSNHSAHTPIESVTPEAAYGAPAAAVSKPVTPERMRTCRHCQYDGPLQVRQTYPVLLRWYMIAAGFAMGVLPGIILFAYRCMTPPTLAITCPLCLFLRLEPATASKL